MWLGPASLSRQSYYCMYVIDQAIQNCPKLYGAKPQQQTHFWCILSPGNMSTVESTVCSYFMATEPLEVSSWLTQTVMDANHRERSWVWTVWTMARNRGSSYAPTWDLPSMIIMNISMAANVVTFPLNEISKLKQIRLFLYVQERMLMRSHLLNSTWLFFYIYFGVHFSTEDTPLVISLEHNNYNTGLSVAEVQHAFDLIAKAVTRLAIVADFVEAKVALLTVITHVGVIALGTASVYHWILQHMQIQWAVY